MIRFVIILMITQLIASCGSNHSSHPSGSPLSTHDSIVDPMKLAQLKLDNVTAYRRVLDRLDIGDLTSLEVSGALLQNGVADTLTRDSMFVAYRDFLNRVAESYLENNETVNRQLGNSPSADMVMQLKLKFANYGMLLSSAKDSFYLEPQNGYLLQRFGSGLSPAYREYLSIADIDQHMPFSRAGKILIPGDSLTSRILRWEIFMVKYPHFISIRTVQDQYAKYLTAFLTGMENSRVFDPETNHLNDSLKVSFESFVEKNPDSKSAQVVKAYLEMLKSTNFNYTDKVDSFLLEKVLSTAEVNTDQ